jgi:hypothetical protein
MDIDWVTFILRLAHFVGAASIVLANYQPPAFI